MRADAIADAEARGEARVAAQRDALAAKRASDVAALADTLARDRKKALARAADGLAAYRETLLAAQRDDARATFEVCRGVRIAPTAAPRWCRADRADGSPALVSGGSRRRQRRVGVRRIAPTAAPRWCRVGRRMHRFARRVTFSRGRREHRVTSLREKT